MAESENADRVCAFDGGRRDETAGRETTHSAQTTATADNFGAAFESIFKKNASIYLSINVCNQHMVVCYETSTLDSAKLLSSNLTATSLY